MNDEERGRINEWRSQVGESFVMLMRGQWELGEVESSGWSAISGINVMGANRFMIHHPDELLKKKYEDRVKDLGLTSSMMFAGEAKKMTVDESVWQELPSTPLMAYDLKKDRTGGIEGRSGELRKDPRVYRARGKDYDRVVRVLKEAFHTEYEQITPSPFAICAKNIDTFDDEEMRIYAIDDDEGNIASIVYGVKVGQNQVLLAMGTTPQCRRKGLGAAVLHAALLDAKNMGLHYSLLFASDLGKLLYESCGFDVIEEWSFYKIRPRKEQSN